MTPTTGTGAALPAAQPTDGPRLPGPLTSVVQALLAAVNDALRPSVARAIIQPGGQVAWDCCTDGQVWVRVIEITPSSTSGTPRPNCPPAAFDVILGVGVVRCVSGMDDNGRPPSAPDLSADGLQMLDDLHTIEQVVLGLPRGKALQPLMPVRWAPMGPEGGCTGQEWEVRVKVDNCG